VSPKAGDEIGENASLTRTPGVARAPAAVPAAGA
jgi:hypothetical protein